MVKIKTRLDKNLRQETSQMDCGLTHTFMMKKSHTLELFSPLKQMIKGGNLVETYRKDTLKLFSPFKKKVIKGNVMRDLQSSA